MDYKSVRKVGSWPASVASITAPCHNREMAVVEEDLEPGPGPVIVVVTVVVLIIALTILFYGLVSLHWFGFDSPASVGAAPTVSPSLAASP
jgi:hypothetical protein